MYEDYDYVLATYFEDMHISDSCFKYRFYDLNHSMLGYIETEWMNIALSLVPVGEGLYL